jgi:ribosomal-protein-alanine N-acetyltransferase
VIVLRTPRIELRRLREEDLEPLAALYADADVRRYFPEGTLGRADTAEEIAWFRDGHPDDARLGLWAAIAREDGAFLGRCGLLPWRIDGRDEVELAYLIDRRRWGEGLATEAAHGIVQHAAECLRLPRLIALILPGNRASIRVAEKVGMHFEAEFAHAAGTCLRYAMRLRAVV